MTTSENSRETRLGAIHRKLGAQMVPFGGWEMPLRYESIVSEHQTVRERAGLFDLGHMGRVRFRGPDALALAQKVQTADVSSLAVGRTRYGLVCNESGGIIDDVLISREDDGLLLVVNAGNSHEDLRVFERHAQALDVSIVDESQRLAMIAIQGPAAGPIVEALGLQGATDLRYYGFGTFESEGCEMLVSRTGYTGEDGFEILPPVEGVESIYNRALEVGADMGLEPCGLGARDTLRLEAGMPLHGHEIDSETNPFEAGLDFAVKFTHDFIGAEALRQVQEEGPERRLVGLFVDGPRVPRTGCPVLVEGTAVGMVCSGTRSPTLGRNIATAMVESAAARAPAFAVDIRGRITSAQPAKLPFYRRKES